MKLFQLFFMSFPLLLMPVLMGVVIPDGASAPPDDQMMVFEGKVVLATDEQVMINFNGQMETFQINADTKIMKDDLTALPIDLVKDDLIRVVSIKSPSGWIAESLEARSNK